MSKEKYLANIDKVLEEVVKRNAPSLGDQDKIAYSKSLEDDGVIKKVAFDVYRHSDDPYNGLWAVSEVEGKPYLIRASDPQYESEGRGDWTVVSSYDKSDITLSYKKVPIARFSSDNFGFDKESIFTFKTALLENVNDETFVKDVLMEQPESKRLALMSEFPELRKIIKG
jgi:hypothetical protein